VPIAILLIQILDVIFHSIQKSHYTSSSFWMPGRNFTTVLIGKQKIGLTFNSDKLGGNDFTKGDQ
jgi:hypothetical protein